MFKLPGCLKSPALVAVSLLVEITMYILPVIIKLTWLGIKSFNHAALLDLTNEIGPNRIKFWNQIESFHGDFDIQKCIMWICNSMVWPRWQDGFIAWCSSWRLDSTLFFIAQHFNSCLCVFVCFTSWWTVWWRAVSPEEVWGSCWKFPRQRCRSEGFPLACLHCVGVLPAAIHTHTHTQYLSNFSIYQ